MDYQHFYTQNPNHSDGGFGFFLINFISLPISSDGENLKNVTEAASVRIKRLFSITI
jgi:hypothetical protein